MTAGSSSGSIIATTSSNGSVVNGSSSSSNNSSASSSGSVVNGSSNSSSSSRGAKGSSSSAPGSSKQRSVATSSRSGGSLSSKDMGLQVTPLFMAPIEYLQEDDRPDVVVVLGWGEQSFMRNVLRELDHGNSALPPASTVLFVNNHDPGSSLHAALEVVSCKNIQCVHYKADPLQRFQLAQLQVLTEIKAAIVLCDEMWVDPDMDSNNGIDELQQRDMLRLDSMVMIVQLNVRKILEDAGRPDAINVICQKVAVEGLTKFEDRTRYPHGISVNFTSYAAKLLAQVTFNPKNMPSYVKHGEVADFGITDASEFCGVGERLTYWELVSRAQLQKQVLVGWYALPRHAEDPMDVVVNLCGEHERGRARVWNSGNGRHKFIVLRSKHSPTFISGSMEAPEKESQAHWVNPNASQSSSSSGEDDEADSGNIIMDTGAQMSRMGSIEVEQEDMEEDAEVAVQAVKHSSLAQAWGAAQASNVLPFLSHALNNVTSDRQRQSVDL